MKAVVKKMAQGMALVFLLNVSVAPAYATQGPVPEPTEAAKSPDGIHVSGEYFGVATVGLLTELALSFVSPSSLFEVGLRSIVIYPTIYNVLTSDAFRAINSKVGPMVGTMYDDSVGPLVDRCINGGLDVGTIVAGAIWSTGCELAGKVRNLAGGDSSKSKDTAQGKKDSL